MKKRSLVRTAQDIKSGLLKRAWATSEEAGQKMEALINEASSRASTLPDKHLETLREIDDSQPRSVMMLNALAKNDGMPVYYTDSSAELPAPEKPTLH